MKAVDIRSLFKKDEGNEAQVRLKELEEELSPVADQEQGKLAC